MSEEFPFFELLSITPCERGTASSESHFGHYNHVLGYMMEWADEPRIPGSMSSWVELMNKQGWHYQITCRIRPPDFIKEWSPAGISFAPDGQPVWTLVTSVERQTELGWEDAGSDKRGDVIYDRPAKGSAVLRFFVATVPAETLWLELGLEVLGLIPMPEDKEGRLELTADPVLQRIAGNLKPPKGYQAQRYHPSDDGGHFRIARANATPLCPLQIRVEEELLHFRSLAKIGNSLRKMSTFFTPGKNSTVTVSGVKVRLKKSLETGWYGPILNLSFAVPSENGTYNMEVKAHEEVFDRRALDEFLAEFPIAEL